MEPITMGLIMLALGLGGGGAAGYTFGSSEKEERFKALQNQITKQAQIIENHERRIKELIIEINEIRQSRSIFQKFMWFVFTSDPKLYAKFADLEKEEQVKSQASKDMRESVLVLKQQFSDHPLVKNN